jgi:hypothetical protein
MDNKTRLATSKIAKKPTIALAIKGKAMSFDEEKNENDEGAKPKTFFGLELGHGLIYGVVIILTLILIR